MKLIIGFIAYSDLTAKYLPYFLDSLDKQIFNNFKILAIDNSEEQDNENSRYIKKHCTDIEIEWAGGNIGFAKAYNKIINKAVDLDAEYILVINPDIILEPDAVLKMAEALDNNGELGSVCPKILRWGFEDNKKTNIIDSCGIQMKPGLRFVDVGQGEMDKGQYDNINILGPSGAAAMYRIETLKKIKDKNQYFDELMFMYKEDGDLAYRLFLSGYKSKCVSGAIVYHDRTTEAKGESNMQIAFNRGNKSQQIKKWSFLNQHIIFFKYWKLQNWNNKLAILWYGLKMFVFVLLFERYLLKQYYELWKLKNKI